jgi:ABC-type glycerol-3-phosphate transport system substrate-binding protein
MRVLFGGILAILIVASVVAHTVVRPPDRDIDRIVDAFFAVGDGPAHADVGRLMTGYRAHARAAGLPEFGRFDEIPSLDPGAVAHRSAFAAYYEAETGRSLLDAPTLIWFTDANPAREVQMALFRAWHLREFGEPIDIATDPSERELTKSMVQSVSGAGPDIIEYLGGSDLSSLVRAGVALDITEYAEEHGFGMDTVFPGARSSIGIEGEDGTVRQYAYPCNVGYMVLLYHRDLFEQAGESPPRPDWTLDDMREAGERVLASGELSTRPRFVIMNLKPYDAALAAGGRLFPERTAAYSVYNSPETVAGLRAYQDLMYVHGAMPRPAEAASMSASTAGGFGSDVSGSAPGLFSQKAILMYVGGRWEYVSFAIANRDRVVVPAIDRRLETLAPGSAEAELLLGARARLIRDVLRPLTDEQHAMVASCLSADDRRRMLNIGAAHVPTVRGRPSYSVYARAALVNRALERDAPERLEYAKRFIRFLGSEAYNDQINGTYDSICGRIDRCVDADGISGPPAPLPGLEGFDSPVFAEAMLEYGSPWELSPYVGRSRMETIVLEVFEVLEAGAMSPEVAAWEAEERINRQILTNLEADDLLRRAWEAETGLDIGEIVPGLRDDRGERVSIRSQIEALLGSRGGGSS